jgi:exonuclease SbcD
MTSWRFVHAADLHLDSPFVGLGQVSAELRQELVAATFTALQRVVEVCLTSGAEFLLLAGDLFDGPRLSLKAQLTLRRELARLADAGIETFIVWGNHDQPGAGALALEWPQGVTVFPPGEVNLAEVRRRGRTLARIYGTSHGGPAETANLAQAFPDVPSGPFALGLLHANLDRTAGHEDYAPCTLADLARPGLDYWALGHIHQPGVRRPAQPGVVYAGNPQGRHLKEAGPRGCYLVEVDGHEARPQFQELAAVGWQELQVDLTGLTRLTDAALRLTEVLENARPAPPAQGLILRLHLVLSGPLARELRSHGAEGELREELRQQGLEPRPWVWVESLHQVHRQLWDLEALRQGSDMAGIIAAMMAAVRESPTLAADLEPLVAPLYRHAQARRYLPPLESLKWQELLDDAADVLLACLFPGEEP